MTNTTNWYVDADTLRSAFKEEHRDDGSSFWSCQHVDAGTELLEFIHELHDEELPNDWRYQTIVQIIDAIIEDDLTNCDPYELADGIANNITDIYNSSLFQWYADHPDRVSYVDEAVGEGLISADVDVIGRLTIGQSECIKSMAVRIIEKLDI